MGNKDTVLEFNDTIKAKNFGNFVIVLQEYTEYNGNLERQIYNVSIEYCIDSFYSETLDIYETYEYDEAEEFYNKLIKSIQNVGSDKNL